MDEELDTFDPCPDVHALFVHYNDLYFDGQLGACSVEWSTSRMTLCAGICCFQRGGGCRIKLSEPLLKLRPSRELKETLLHEMIHAYMFLRGVRDRGDHGPMFVSKMEAINNSRAPDSQRPPSGYHVTVYHSLHAEVDHYRKHWWECESCSRLVKRAMNRPPQEADCRGRMGRGAQCADPHCAWHTHLRDCGGVFKKVRSPERPSLKQASKRIKAADAKVAVVGPGPVPSVLGRAGSSVQSPKSLADTRLHDQPITHFFTASKVAGPEDEPIHLLGSQDSDILEISEHPAQFSRGINSIQEAVNELTTSYSAAATSIPPHPGRTQRPSHPPGPSNIPEFKGLQSRLTSHVTASLPTAVTISTKQQLPKLSNPLRHVEAPGLDREPTGPGSRMESSSHIEVREQMSSLCAAAAMRRILSQEGKNEVPEVAQDGNTLRDHGKETVMPQCSLQEDLQTIPSTIIESDVLTDSQHPVYYISSSPEM